MNQEKRRCPSDYSLEELEELEVELKRRRMETNAAPSPSESNTFLSIATTRQILSNFCFASEYNLDERGGSFPLEDTMSLLRFHPLLVAEPFSERSVLSYLLVANAPLSIIKEFCVMWKAAKTRNEIHKLWKEEGYENGPNFVADACLYSKQPDILKVLLEEFPEQTEMQDPGFCACPLELFLMRCDHFDDDLDVCDPEPCPTGEEASRMCQMLLLSTQNHRFLSEISEHWVVCGHYGNEVSDLLAKQLFGADMIEGLLLDHPARDVWDEKSIERSTLILPKVKKFEIRDFARDICLYYGSTLNMFSQVKPTMLTQLELPVFFGFFRVECNQQLFVEAIQSCSSLLNLRLVNAVEQAVSYLDAADGRALCKICKDIQLLANKLETLNVAVPPATDGASLSMLFQAALKLKSADVRCCNQYMYSRSNDCLPPFEVPTNGVLQNLILDCSIGLKSMKGLLGHLTELVSLSKISIAGVPTGTSKNLKLNKEIVAILAQNHLEELSLECGWLVCLDALVDVLKKNTSLKTLRCPLSPTVESSKKLVNMMEHNLSLENVQLHFSTMDLTQTIYWTNLNKCGRVKLAEPDAPMGELVNSLETAAQKFPDSNEEGNLWYGLLRLNPGPWAEAALATLSHRA